MKLWGRGVRQLRCSKAEVMTIPYGYIMVKTCAGDVYKCEKPIVLQSYNSIVAIFDRVNETVYFMPHFEYSHTTSQHVHKFLQDYCFGCDYNLDTSYNEIRALGKNAKRGDPYVLCEGYYQNSMSEEKDITKVHFSRS